MYSLWEKPGKQGTAKLRVPARCNMISNRCQLTVKSKNSIWKKKIRNKQFGKRREKVYYTILAKLLSQTVWRCQFSLTSVKSSRDSSCFLEKVGLIDWPSVTYLNRTAVGEVSPILPLPVFQEIKNHMVGLNTGYREDITSESYILKIIRAILCVS